MARIGIGTRILFALAALLALPALWSGCGGPSSSSDSTDETARAQAAARAEAARDEEEARAAQAAAELEHVYYQVFWREIHVLTVYQTAGPLRSEEPRNPAAGLSGDCEYMSAVSHYFEQEHEMARLIERADSLDGFFALLAEDPDFDVREAYLEEGY